MEKLSIIDRGTGNEPMLGIETQFEKFYICEVFNLGHDVGQPTDEEAEKHAERIIEGWNTLPQTKQQRDDLLAACKDLVGLLEQIFQALVTSASNEVADTIIKYGTANHSNTVEEARSLIASVEAT